MSEELKPCPFCGGKPHLREPDAPDPLAVTESGNVDYRIWCEECNAMSKSYQTKEKAIKYWNMRTKQNQGLKIGLKACPLCGGKARRNSFVSRYEEYWVECTNCGLKTDWFCQSNCATKSWNGRSNNDRD